MARDMVAQAVNFVKKAGLAAPRLGSLLTTTVSVHGDLLSCVYLRIQENPVHLQPSCSHIISARYLYLLPFVPCLKASLDVAGTFSRGFRGRGRKLKPY